VITLKGVKRTLFNFYLQIKRSLSRRLLRLAFVYLKFGSPTFRFVYDSKSVTDGFGAQFHRICSIIHVSKMINGKIQRPKISQVAIHPLDPFQNIYEMELFLDGANAKLFERSGFSQDSISDKRTTLKFVRIKSVNIIGLIKLRIKYSFRNVEVVIVCQDAHSLADSFINSYRTNIYPFFEFLLDCKDYSTQCVVLHIRQGHGNFAIYPGQKISRELPIEYFDSIVDSIIRTVDVSDYELVIFTDAPKEDLAFSPPPQQEYLWRGMPGFDGQNLTHKGRDLEQHFTLKYSTEFSKVNLIRDINPVEMLLIMIGASYLGVSRSSLSFIAGILNPDGTIFAPPNFWHPSPKAWRVISNELKT